MTDPLLVLLGVLAFVGLLLGINRWSSHRFDRRHPNLTREALRARQPEDSP